MTAQQILDLEIDLLQPNPLQPRGLITTESLRELVASIKEQGILEPLVVAKTPAGYQIIAGERRWRAARLAGLGTVPVILREATHQKMLEMALVENVQREDLNPLERAQAFKRLVEEFGLSVGEIAKRIGRSPPYISNSIHLLILPDALKDGLLSGAVTEGHVRAILALEENPQLMIEAYKIILKENGSVRRAEELARIYKAKGGLTRVIRKLDNIHSEELVQMEKDFEVNLDAKNVKIFQSRVAARVIFYFWGNLEETTGKLRRIHDNLCSQKSE